MNQIKTWQERLHKLEGGQGDRFLTLQQAMQQEINALRQAIKQAGSVEPQAWMPSGGIPMPLDNATPEQAKIYGWQPLYLDPPPAPAQPLTEEQIDFAWFKAMKSTPGTALPIHEFARAIEAHIKGASL